MYRVNEIDYVIQEALICLASSDSRVNEISGVLKIDPIQICPDWLWLKNRGLYRGAYIWPLSV